MTETTKKETREEEPKTKGFEFYYEPKFELESREVREADEARVEMNTGLNAHLYQSDSYCSHPSITTQRVLRRGVDHLKKATAKINLDELATLDRIVLQDVLANVSRADVYLRGRCEGEGMTPSVYLNGFFGNNAYMTIKDAVRPRGKDNPYGYPNKEIHDFSLARIRTGDDLLVTEELLGGMQGLDLSDIRKEIKKAFVEKGRGAKRLIKELFDRMGMVKNFGEFRLDFSPAGGPNCGSYNDRWDIIFIDPDGIEIVKNPNVGGGRLPYRLATPGFLTTAAHEGSHLVRKHLSRRCMEGIPGLSPDFSSWVLPFQGVDEEGLTQNVEDYNLEFMTKNSDGYDLKPEDLALEKKFKKIVHWKGINEIMFSILREEQERADKTGHFGRKNVGEELAEISKSPWHKTNYRSFTEYSLDELMRDPLVYFLGYVKIKKMLESLVDEHDMSRREAIMAAHYGVWVDIESQKKFITEVWLPGYRKAQK